MGLTRVDCGIDGGWLIAVLKRRALEGGGVLLSQIICSAWGILAESGHYNRGIPCSILF